MISLQQPLLLIFSVSPCAFFPPLHLFLISSAWPHSVWVLIGSCLRVSTFHQCCYMTGRLDFCPSYFQFSHSLTPTFAVTLSLSSFILISLSVPCIISFFLSSFFTLCFICSSKIDWSVHSHLCSSMICRRCPGEERVRMKRMGVEVGKERLSLSMLNQYSLKSPPWNSPVWPNWMFERALDSIDRKRRRERGRKTDGINVRLPQGWSWNQFRHFEEETAWQFTRHQSHHTRLSQSLFPWSVHKLNWVFFFKECGLCVQLIENMPITRAKACKNDANHFTD